MLLVYYRRQVTPLIWRETLMEDMYTMRYCTFNELDHAVVLCDHSHAVGGKSSIIGYAHQPYDQPHIAAQALWHAHIAHTAETIT